MIFYLNGKLLVSVFGKKYRENHLLLVVVDSSNPGREG